MTDVGLRSATRATAGPLASLSAARVLLGPALLLAVAHPLLPEPLIRVPQAMVLPYDVWAQALFDFIKDDLGLIHVTRTISGGLERLPDSTANLLHGKNRWPYLGPIPWTAVAAVIGYGLGGWKFAARAGGPVSGSR